MTGARTAEGAGESVAVIGVGLRLPGGITTLGGLWDALATGQDLVTSVPGDRFRTDDFVVDDGGVRAGKAYTGAAGIFGDVWGFDPEYFGISPKEAGQIDPQQRLLMECAVEAFDDGGVDPRLLAGSDVAVVMGMTVQDYWGLLMRRPGVMNSFAPTGTGAFGAANRLSYLFDFHGPSHTVDTACSSSLTALHLAAETVRSGRCEVALAGGVNLVLGPGGHVISSQASMLSPTGRSHSFSQDADGFVRSEGAGVVLLKTLSRALADGDRVHAVIRASVVNADGRTLGMSLPGADTQATMLERAYAEAGVRADQVSYVEAHGTGTAAGDPVECEALGRILGRRRGGKPLPIGSVKSNLGHLEAAAGMAGLFKAMLVLRERRVPATLHAQPLNRAIDFAGLGLDPVTAMRPLDGGAGARRIAGVNSFGIGGANAHVVLESPDAPPVPGVTGDGAARTEDRRPGAAVPVVVTGRTEAALREAALTMASYLEGMDDSALVDVGFTTVRRRERRELSTAVLASSGAAAARALRETAERGASDAAASAVSTARGRVGFIFSGNGTQWPRMGAELLGQDAAFTAEVRAVSRELEPLLGWSVEAEMAAPDSGRWALTEVAQPMLFALQAGLVMSLRERGVRPHGVCGHSVGEVAAAYCAGIFDRPQACRVIAHRSLAQAPTFGTGRMAALALSPARAQRLLDETGASGRVVIAAVNSGNDVTLAGDSRTLEAVEDRCVRDSVSFRFLRLDYPFHSPAMDTVRGPLLAGLGEVAAGRGRIPLVSTVTGRAVAEHEMDADYWWRNVREPVRFAAAVAALIGEEHGCDVLVEVGPHPALSGYLRRIAVDGEASVEVASTLTRISAGPPALSGTVLRAVAAGARLDWDRFFPQGGRVVDVPAYPWQRRRYRLGDPSWWSDHEIAPPSQPVASHPLLGRRLLGADPTWGREQSAAWIADHRIGDAVVMPGTAFLDMALSAAREVHGGPVELLDISLARSLVLPGEPGSAPVRTTTTVRPDGTFVVAGHTGEDIEAVQHVNGRWRGSADARPAPLDVAALARRVDEPVDMSDHYRACAAVSLNYGPAFRSLTTLSVKDGEGLARLHTDQFVGTEHQARVVLLDGCLQAMLPLSARVVSGSAHPYVPHLPVAVGSVRVWGPLPATVLAYLRLTSVVETGLVCDITVCDTDGTVLLDLGDVYARRIENSGSPAPRVYDEVLRARPRMTALPGTPCPLPPPSRVVEDCGPVVTRLDDAVRDHGYDGHLERSRQLSAHYMVAAVNSILDSAVARGAIEVAGPVGGQAFGLDDLRSAGVRESLCPLVEMMLAIAVRYGLLTARAEGGWCRRGTPVPEELLRDRLNAFPELVVMWQAAAWVGRSLPGVLTGEVEGLEVLFGESGPIAAQVYNHDPGLTYLSDTAVAYVRAALADWPADRPLRILEIGAGTGGFTARILPHLPPERTHYVYTDVSSAFFPKAEARFAAFNFLEYHALDLSTDPTEQGFAAGSFDLVVASNALHTTVDITQGLRHAATLLDHNGQLVALEMHSNTYVATLFGILDSFWESSDTALRPAGAALTREQWPSVLEQAGFSAAAFLSAQPDREGVPGSVIAAVRAMGTRPGSTPRDQDAGGATPPCLLITESADSSADPLGDLLAAALTATGTREVVRSAPRGQTDWAALLPAAGPVDIVLIADDTERTTAERVTAERVTARAARACARLSTLAAVCAQTGGALRPTLWLVASTTADSLDAPMTHTGAALWGATRTLANEQPLLTVRRIRAVGGTTGSARQTAGHVAYEITHPDAEDECVITRHGRFAVRVQSLPETRRTRAHGATAPFALAVHGEAGTPHRLVWQDSGVPDPGPGEITVRVRAAALNGRDALFASGRLLPPRGARPGDVHLGCEGAGTVTAVGDDVTGILPGDRVAGITHGGWLASHINLRADRVVKLPEQITFAGAATLLIAQLTTHHVLGHLAGLGPGDSVLILGGSDGTGLAAMEFARRAGSRVVVGAPTPAQRALLRLPGVDHVVDSGAPGFAEEVRHVTRGGVDVIVNLSSITADLRRRALDLLAPGGHFFDVGPLVAPSPTPHTPPLDRDATLHAVDVVGWFEQSPLTVDRCLDDLQKVIDSGECRPLPHTVYPADRVHEAMDGLLAGQGAGKTVVVLDDGVLLDRAPEPPVLDPTATYLVVGGLDGFGAETARHLVRRGARHLTLVSRRGTARNQDAVALVSSLNDQGVQVDARAVDISDPTTVDRLFHDLDASGRRLAGVVHAAMVLDDDEITDLSVERYLTVLRPKLTGALLLDSHTRRRTLDFFALYSSFAALLGNRRQASYGAASLALENIARRRRHDGLPASVLQLGAISDAGYVLRSGITSVMSDYGILPMTSSQALDRFDTLLHHPDSAVTAVVAESRGREQALMAFLPAVTAPRTAMLVHTPDAGADDSLLPRLRAAATAEEARPILLDALTSWLASGLHTTPDRVDSGRRIDQLGADSLTATELIGHIRRHTGCAIPAPEVMTAPLTSIATTVLRHLRPESPS
ncbi:type I polyketide synthase [Streptomyces corynorhini]|uniref:SDR family NAD(P)-dependent oxidoreductase n=1 Tax=Streptomyces corynorhini TaxID=2282652 RepID=A0A370B847_9ACTN|nr:type I polyketide synthase [Streptomyces corynorhini]RDG37781.1 SDR family NAD(P)-dependent oxidoreductase [Streptomyces corynorhini]